MGIIAEYIGWQYLQVAQTYFSQPDFTLGNLAVLFPIGVSVAFVVFVIAFLRAVRLEAQIPSLRQIVNRYRFSLWVELPLGFVLLVFAGPGVYGLYTLFSHPNYGFWTAEATETVILIQLLFIVGIILVADSLWQSFVIPSREERAERLASGDISQRTELDPRFSQAEARLFYPWHYYVPLISTFFGLWRNLNHIPHDKLILEKRTRKAYWIGDYAKTLLVPVQKIEWISERKPRVGFSLKKWADEHRWTLIEQTATEADLT